MTIRTLLIVIALILAIVALIPSFLVHFNLLALAVVLIAVALILPPTQQRLVT